MPLHDVGMGYCSCGDTSEKHMGTSAGKHPIAKAWGPGALVDEGIAAAVFGGRPGMNFGIKTGVQAGAWVLDVDPAHGGDQRLIELTKEHGALPDTYTQRTGSGGLHHFFALPHDFTPTNSRGSLPIGLDVRGEGGFVVAAPCRSGIGDYEILLNLPVVPAPDWLLEMIRPRVPADVEHRAALEHWESPLLAGQNDRLARYGHAAMLAELELMARATPGSRGSTAHRVACNLIELVNSPWSGVSEEAAKGAFAAAAARAMAHGGAFDEREAWAAWGSAARRIGARGRAAPAPLAGGVLIPWGELGGVPPFSPAQGPQNILDGSLSNRPMIGTAVPIMDIGPAQGANGSVPILGPGETAVDPVDAMISTWLDSEMIAGLPAPQWLIKDWIPRHALVQTVGQPGHGKSFVALDQALHLALGRDWHGHRVERVKVAYMVAEGAPGMGQRVKAWCQRFNGGARVEGIWFIPYPVQARDNAAWENLMMACHRLGLEYIVLDTQARVTVGMEENSAKEMGEFVDQVERLRRITNATVNLVHHQNKAGGSARGSSAMLGALHTEITVSRLEARVTSTVTKQKDAETAMPLLLELRNELVGERPPMGWISAVGEPIYAAVLVDVDRIDAAEYDKLTNKAKILMLLKEIFPMRGATKAEARTEAYRRGMAKQSFSAAWDELVGKGRISRAIVDDVKTQSYVVTPEENIPSPQA